MNMLHKEQIKLYLKDITFVIRAQVVHELDKIMYEIAPSGYEKARQYNSHNRNRKLNAYQRKEINVC